MTRPLARRPFLLAAAALTLLAGCDVASKAEGDMALGAPAGAKVTVVEYASVTCGVCAAWQDEVWPGFKAKYVDTSTVRYVFRELPTPPMDVAAAGFQIARCAGDDKYFDVVHQIMASQKEWQAGTPPRDTLFRIAAAAGLSESETQACMIDPEGLKAIDARIQVAKDAGVTGTPAFYVNGVAVPDRSMSGLSAAIDAALTK